MEKKDKKFRKRPEEGNDDDVQAKKELIAKDKKAASSLLSFGGEEEEDGDTFVPVKKKEKKAKKAKSSFGVAPVPLPFDAERRVSTQRAAAGEYTADKLAALKRNTLTSSYTSGAPAATATRLAPMTMSGPVDDDPVVLTPEGIPDLASIKAAKDRRERMRQQGAAASDYIAFNKGAPVMPGERPAERTLVAPIVPDATQYGESRLVRDDLDHDVSEAFLDEQGSRIQFGDPSKLEKSDNPKQIDLRHDSVPEWEADLIRKGSGKNAIADRVASMAGAKKEAKPKAAQADVGRLRVPAPKPGDATLTVDAVMRRLNAQFTSLQTAHSARVDALAEVTKAAASAAGSTAALTSEFGDLEKRYRFFQELRVYAAEMADCLDEKVPVVDELEDRAVAAWRARAAAAAERTLVDVREQMEAVHSGAAPTDPLQDPDKERRRIARLQRRARAEERRRKAAERQRKEGMVSLGGTGEEAGWSSDDEDGGDVAAFDAEQQAIQDEAAAVFADVEEDYSSLERIKEKFAAWKTHDPHTYRDAYAVLSLRSVAELFVRVELLAWNPIEGAYIDDMRWFNTLIDVGSEEDSTQEEQQFMPELVGAVVVPHVKTAVAEYWRPESRRHTELLQKLLKELFVFFEEDKIETVFKDVLSAVAARIQRAIEQLIVPVLSGGRGEDFVQYQFVRGLKLLRNICSWVQRVRPEWSVLGVGVLRALGIERLVVGKLLPAVAASHTPAVALSRLAAISSVLEPTWLPSSLHVLDHATATLLRTVWSPLAQYITASLAPAVANADKAALRQVASTLLESDAARTLSKQLGEK